MNFFGISQLICIFLDLNPSRNIPADSLGNHSGENPSNSGKEFRRRKFKNICEKAQISAKSDSFVRPDPFSQKIRSELDSATSLEGEL